MKENLRNVYYNLFFSLIRDFKTYASYMQHRQLIPEFLDIALDHTIENSNFHNWNLLYSVYIYLGHN
jgi:hypothetical protein